MGVLIARLRESFAVFNFKNHCFGLLLLSQALTCVSASCTPPEIPHSLTSHSSEPVLSSDRLKIVCDFAYRLVGSAYITCQEDGTWSASYGSLSFPQCVPVENSKCSRPIIPNGKVLNPNIIDHRGHPSWSEEEVVCDGGFKLVGTPFIVCKNGHWSAAYGSAENFPVCTEMQRKRCLPISHNDNVVVKYEIELKNATAYCKAGYHMDMRAPASLICERGQWLGRFPRCWKHCPPISVIPNTVVKYSLDRANATIYCKKGYHMEMRSPAHLYCHLGQWEGMVPECRKLCPAPPEIPFANVQYYKENPVDGAKVTYHCNNGYSMDNQSLAELTCRDGEWPGKLPTCIYRCDPPEEIANGHWEEVGGAYPYTKIKYRCNRHFRAQGPSLLWCQEDHTWSHIPPQCLPDTDPVVYCASPPNLSHGECTCAGRAQSYCEPFRPGMRWVCRCDDGYMLGGAEAITCTVAGEWSNNMPTCLPVDSQVNTAGPVQEGSHISTLAIVVATACSVLGVLLLVMVAVIFRRHKPRPRLYHATPAPPPYTRVHSNSVDEHDRVALIAYAEGRQPTLPTYDEATRGMPSVGTSPHTHSVVNMGSGEAGLAGQQYRPLPPIPPTLRGTAPTTTAQSAADNNNRHSTATTSTVHNRDGFSEVFGSLDTVNVSISDASTAGTTETVDSGASNPSLASRRANAGSLGSSNGSLATDDAPLLESGHDGRIMSTGSEPLPEEDKEE